MRLYFYAEIELISDNHSDLSQSPEDFILGLEDQLESGELTLDEISQLLADYRR